MWKFPQQTRKTLEKSWHLHLYRLDMSKLPKTTMVARERVTVLDSVHGVSKGLFEIAEVRVVVLWRRDHLQQPRLHFLRKTAQRQLVNLTSETRWIHIDTWTLNTWWHQMFNVGTFCGMLTTPHPTWNVNSVCDSVLPNTNVILTQKSLSNPLCPTAFFVLWDLISILAKTHLSDQTVSCSKYSLRVVCVQALLFLFTVTMDFCSQELYLVAPSIFTWKHLLYH